MINAFKEKKLLVRIKGVRFYFFLIKRFWIIQLSLLKLLTWVVVRLF